MNFKGNKRLKLALYIAVIGVAALVVGTSFALFNTVVESNKNQVIKVGAIALEYKETGTSLKNASLAIQTDEAALASSNYYSFSIKNIGSEKAYYKVMLIDEEGKTNTLNYQYVRANVTIDGVQGDVFNLQEVQNVIEDGTIEVGVTKEYILRLWLNFGDLTDDEIEQELNKEAYLKIKVIAEQIPQTLESEGESNIPNAPELATNMIPVTYDSENDTWVKADSTNSNNSWYNYDNKVWANAVTVTSANRQTYLDATAGTPIPMDDINTMWVWIPRFSATMGSVDCSTVTGTTYEEYPMCYDLTLTTEQQTAIMEGFGVDESTVQALLDGETVDGLDLAVVIELYNTQVAPDNPIVPDTEFNSSLRGNTKSFEIDFTTTSETSHDAFTFGNDKLAGFWMAKFEPSHPTLSDVTESNLLGCTNDTCENAKGIEILPNKVSLRNNNVSNMFYAGRSLEQSENNYGLIANEIDTHMMKNNEWGAVAYLTYSEFGRCTDDLVCTDIGINNNGSTEDYSNITGYGAPAGSAVGVENGAYNTALGMDASTTGNIYGVYDMSGGTSEYVMGVYKPETLSGIRDDSGFSTETSNSQYDKLTIGTQYYNVYTTSEAYDNAGLQHAVNETNGWYGDLVVFVSPDPWFLRSSDFDSGGVAGVFTAYGVGGYASNKGSFRPVLVK